MDEALFKKVAEQVESEWHMGGLSEGIYYDYALEIARRYFSIQQGQYTRPDKPEPDKYLEGIMKKVDDSSGG